MKDANLTIMIIVLSLIKTSMDISSTDYKDCYNEHPRVFLTLFLHAFIAVFSYLGCFYNNRNILIFYIVSHIVVPVHWLLNDNKCILSVSVNEICGFDINRRYLTLSKGTINLYILKIICFFIAIYRLRKM
jgi:hypothetical protein